MTVYDEIGLAVFRELHSQDGLWDVTAANPPGMDVWVGEHLLTLPVGHPAFPRTDVVSVDRSGRTIRVTIGEPSPVALRPTLPGGDVPMAIVRIPVAARAVYRDMVERLPLPQETT